MVTKGLKHRAAAFPGPQPRLRPTLCPEVKGCMRTQSCLTLQLLGLQPPGSSARGIV